MQLLTTTREVPEVVATASFTADVQMAPLPCEFLPQNRDSTSMPDLATCDGAKKGGMSTPIALSCLLGPANLVSVSKLMVSWLMELTMSSARTG